MNVPMVPYFTIMLRVRQLYRVGVWVSQAQHQYGLFSGLFSINLSNFAFRIQATMTDGEVSGRIRRACR
jgi:hypothetical protein